MAIVLHRNHDVLRLEVPVNHFLAVQMLQCNDYLSSVELDIGGDSFVVVSDLAQESAASDQLELQVNV